MAKIDISDFDTLTLESSAVARIGSDLFSDSESFMNELSGNELAIVGGYEIYKFPITPTSWTLPTPFPVDPYPHPTID
jgi:hypothetical protein